jgi:hypothetical protein
MPGFPDLVVEDARNFICLEEKASEGSLNRLERGVGSWCRGDMEGATCHVPTSPLSQRLCSVPTLVPRFASERRQGIPDENVRHCQRSKHRND